MALCPFSVCAAAKGEDGDDAAATTMEPTLRIMCSKQPAEPPPPALCVTSTTYGDGTHAVYQRASTKENEGRWGRDSSTVYLACTSKQYIALLRRRRRRGSPLPELSHYCYVVERVPGTSAGLGSAAYELWRRVRPGEAEAGSTPTDRLCTHSVCMALFVFMHPCAIY